MVEVDDDDVVDVEDVLEVDVVVDVDVEDVLEVEEVLEVDEVLVVVLVVVDELVELLVDVVEVEVVDVVEDVEDVLDEVVVDELDDELVEDVLELGDVVDVVLVVVVGPPPGQTPSNTGRVALKSVVPPLVKVLSGPNCTLYRSPLPSRPICKARQPPVPGFGGTTSTMPLRPCTTALSRNVPPDVRFTRSRLTGPCSPCASLY